MLKLLAKLSFDLASQKPMSVQPVPLYQFLNQNPEVFGFVENEFPSNLAQMPTWKWRKAASSPAVGQLVVEQPVAESPSGRQPMSNVAIAESREWLPLRSSPQAISLPTMQYR